MSRDYTDEDLDLLRANLYAETGVTATREMMAVMAQVLPDWHLDRCRKALTESGHTVADLDTGE